MRFDELEAAAATQVIERRRSGGRLPRREMPRCEDCGRRAYPPDIDHAPLCCRCRAETRE